MTNARTWVFRGAAGVALIVGALLASGAVSHAQDGSTTPTPAATAAPSPAAAPRRLPPATVAPRRRRRPTARTTPLTARTCAPTPVRPARRRAAAAAASTARTARGQAQSRTLTAPSRQPNGEVRAPLARS